MDLIEAVPQSHHIPFIQRLNRTMIILITE
jgi:hypothetical protein